MADIAVLEVHLHGRFIGTLTRLPGDQNLFTFTDEYINDPERPTLSLSFKGPLGELVTETRYTQTRLPPFFSNLLPEGAMREYLAARAKVKSIREFFLLWILGRDLPGALQVLADGDELPDDEAQETSREPADGGPLRFSLAGVQLKFSAIQEATGGLTIPVDGTGGSWIVKLPSTRFRDVPQNEFAMMELARRIGIEVPETTLIPIRDITGLPSGVDAVGDVAFAIRRFDRDGAGEAIHMEDFAQVFGLYPADKYRKASYRNIAEVLWAETGEEGIAEFLRRFVFNALIGNADMHLKNWSLIYPDRQRPRLSPAYDFVSTIIYLPDDELALGFAGSKSFESLTEKQFINFAAKAGLPQKLTLDTVRTTLDDFARAWRGGAGLSLGSKARAAIDAHLKRVPIWKPFSSKTN